MVNTAAKRRRARKSQKMKKKRSEETPVVGEKKKKKTKIKNNKNKRRKTYLWGLEGDDRKLRQRRKRQHKNPQSSTMCCTSWWPNGGARPERASWRKRNGVDDQKLGKLVVDVLEEVVVVTHGGRRCEKGETRDFGFWGTGERNRGKGRDGGPIRMGIRRTREGEERDAGIGEKEEGGSMGLETRDPEVRKTQFYGRKKERGGKGEGRNEKVDGVLTRVGKVWLMGVRKLKEEGGLMGAGIDLGCLKIRKEERDEGLCLGVKEWGITSWEQQKMGPSHGGHLNRTAKEGKGEEDKGTGG